MKNAISLMILLLVAGAAYQFGRQGGATPVGVIAPEKATVPTPPDTLADSEVKIREASEKMRTQFIPLLKKLPGDFKRAEALIKANEELLRSLPRTATNQPK